MIVLVLRSTLIPYTTLFRSSAFARVAADIGTLYSLGYYPTNKARDGKYRAIKLEVRGVKDKAEIRARDGYYRSEERRVGEGRRTGSWRQIRNENQRRDKRSS